MYLAAKIALLILAVILILGLLGIGGWCGYKKIVQITKDYSSKLDDKKSLLDKEDMIEKKDIEVKKVKKEKISGILDANERKHYVRWGDNLWNICKQYYGDPWYYPALADANPGIINPRLIYAGTYIIIPSKSSLKRWEIIE